MIAQTWRILEGDCRARMAEVEPASVQTCVTSPPYFGLRDYGTSEWQGGDPACDHLKPEGANAGRPGRTFTAQPPYRDNCGKCGARRIDRQIGLEPTPDEFVAALVGVFREVRRVLRDDGTVWCNLGDSYGAGKQLLGIPWRFAFAMQADGWVLRSDVVWAKSNPMPESVTDRPTKSHEFIFMLAKGRVYYYDADAIREEGAGRLDLGQMTSPARLDQGGPWTRAQKDEADGRNKRSVWTVATQPFAGAHFATFPPKLIEPCILAGSREGDTVLDPFSGAGTTGMVALRHGRSYIGIELNSEYAEMSRWRLRDDAPLLNTGLELAA